MAHLYYYLDVACACELRRIHRPRRSVNKARDPTELHAGSSARASLADAGPHPQGEATTATGKRPLVEGAAGPLFSYSTRRVSAYMPGGHFSQKKVGRTSENTSHAKFREFTFLDVGRIANSLELECAV